MTYQFLNGGIQQTSMIRRKTKLNTMIFAFSCDNNFLNEFLFYQLANDKHLAVYSNGWVKDSSSIPIETRSISKQFPNETNKNVQIGLLLNYSPSNVLCGNKKRKDNHAPR